MDSCYKYIDHFDLSLRRYFLFVMPKSIFGISVELYADFIYIILMDFFFLFSNITKYEVCQYLVNAKDVW